MTTSGLIIIAYTELDRDTADLTPCDLDSHLAALIRTSQSTYPDPVHPTVLSLNADVIQDLGYNVKCVWMYFPLNQDLGGWV